MSIQTELICERGKRGPTPIQALHRRGAISHDELWAATRFAAGFEATMSPYAVKAMSLEWTPAGTGADSPTDRPLDYRDVAQDYQIAVEHMRRRDPNMPTVMVAVTVYSRGTERIDTDSKRRKGWAMGLFKEGLKLYLTVCARQLQREKARGIA